jgi:hypothetical protein
MYKNIIISLVLVIIIFYVISIYRAKDKAKYIYGFYSSDSSFNEDSGLEKFDIFIGDKTGKWWNKDKRKIAAIMVTKDGKVIDEIAEITINSVKCNGDQLTLECNIEESPISEIMDERVTIEIDTLNGLMKIYNKDDKTLYGLFWKDSEVTFMSRDCD